MFEIIVALQKFTNVVEVPTIYPQEILQLKDSFFCVIIAIPDISAPQNIKYEG